MVERSRSEQQQQGGGGDWHCRDTCSDLLADGGGLPFTAALTPGGSGFNFGADFGEAARTRALRQLRMHY